MMKRILSLIMALLMIICACPAHAEGDVSASVWEAVYRIVLRTEAEDITLGSAVLFTQQDVLLTAESCCREGDLYAIGEDGEHAIAEVTPLQDSGAALMRMHTPSAAQPLTLAGYETQSLPFIFGTDAQGKIGVAPLYHVIHAMYRDQQALQLYGAEGLLPGAVVADERGKIVAVTVAQQMEGMGVYTALESDGLYQLLYPDVADEAFLPVEITWDGGYMNIAWQDEKRDSGIYLLSLTSEENLYYTSYEASAEDSSLRIALPAGHTYLLQVQWAASAGEAAFSWNAMDVYTLPELPLNEYDYQMSCYLASIPRGKDITGVLPEMPLISVDTLSAERQALYLQIKSSYTVTEEVSLPMTVSLTAPDGQFYFEELLCPLDPAKAQDDTYVLSMDELFASCRDFSGKGKLQPGEYAVRVHIGGYLAGEYPFTVQPEGTPLPAVESPALPESGFVTGISVTEENGLYQVDWSDCAIPEGKQVTAYVLYDGNTYYSFSEPGEGVTSAKFPVIPGVGCLLWAAYADEGSPSELPQSLAECVMPAAAPRQAYTQYSFVNLRSSVVASEDPQAAENGLYLPEIPLTREQITGGMHIYFQTEDTYDIPEISADHILLVVLHTPEGLHFIRAGGYTFDPAWQASDLWLLDITELFRSYEGMVHTEPWPAGEYTVGYYIDGQVAAEVQFILE